MAWSILLWPWPLAAQPATAPAAVETIRVRAPRPSVTGVTGTAAGGGLIGEERVAKQQSTISVDFIAKQTPSANSFDLLRLTPGANTASSDPYGLSPGVNITLRGLNGDEVAYLLEGAPLNDIGYYAGYPSQWVDSENISTIALSQGTADLDTPTINATGGLINVRLRDPAATPGGLISASYGSYHAVRGFARVDTGAIGDTGIRGFVSFSQTQADNYRGPGHDQRQHVDYKFVKDFSDGSNVAIVGSYHDAILSSYPNPTLADWRQWGRSFNYQAGFTNAGVSPVCADYGEPPKACYWKLYQQPWRDVQISMPTHIVLNDVLAWDTTPYFEHGFGNAPYGDILPTTANAGLAQGVQPITQLNVPNAQNGQAYVLGDYIGNQFRAGFVTKLAADIGVNRFVAGYWYDYADDYDPEPFTPVGRDGDPASIWGFPYTIKLPNGANYSLQEAHTLEQVNALFVGDTINLLDGQLQIDAGLKYAMVNRDGRNGLPGPQYKVGLNSSQPLPRAAVRYQITPAQQVFASVSTNFRSPVEYVLYNTYDGYGDLFNIGTHQKDEYSISEELGYRYQDKLLDAAISFFNYNFTNRQVPTIVNLGSSQIASSINAGGQTSRGIDAEIGFRPIDHLRPYVSAEYLHATTDNDFLVAAMRGTQQITDYLPTAGKTAVRSPAFQGAVGLDYDDGTYFGNVSVKYVGSQYATFLNDEQIPGHAQADATLGFRLPDIGAVHRPEARLNFINLTDAKFLSGVAAVTPNAQNAIGRDGGTVAGSAPAYYIGPGFAAMLTLVAGF
ncbi:MAG TPA: TonB-dependent receptor [Acetobacteraceae bacterium]|nr:TonB-dependent receptor [Acetobacteraceae bacterium]